MNSSQYDAAPERRAVLTSPPSLVQGFSVCSSVLKQTIRNAFLVVFFRVEQTEVFPDNLVCGIALDFLSALVPVLDVSVNIEQNVHIVFNFCDHPVIALLALPQ